MAEEQNGEAVNLQIVTPTGMVVDTAVDIVTLPGAEGEFGVLFGHTPFFTTMRPGIVGFEEGGMPRRYAVSAGFVEVTQEKVIVLARTCEDANEIDAERARLAREKAEAKLSELPGDSDERDYYETKVKRADARLEISEKD